MAYIIGNMAVQIARNIGKIWDMKNCSKYTEIIVTGKEDNIDYKVVLNKETQKVTIEPWIW